MFKSRLILVLAVISLLSVTMAVSNSFSSVSPAIDQGATDFHQRHPDWQWVASDQKAVIPLTGDAAFPDYHQRHPELTARAESSMDLTDYFFRHPELRLAGVTTPVAEGLEAPGSGCESPVDCR